MSHTHRRQLEVPFPERITDRAQLEVGIDVAKLRYDPGNSVVPRLILGASHYLLQPSRGLSSRQRIREQVEIFKADGGTSFSPEWRGTITRIGESAVMIQATHGVLGLNFDGGYLNRPEELPRVADSEVCVIAEDYHSLGLAPIPQGEDAGRWEPFILARIIDPTI